MLILNIFIVISVLILVPVLYWYYILFKYRSLNKIPGPKPLMFLGNVFSKDPYDLYDDFQKLHKEYGPTVRVYAGPYPTVIMSKPEHIQAVLSSSVHLDKPFGYLLIQKWLGDGLIIASGEKWKRDRKLLNPTFHFSILESFMPIFNSNSDILVQQLARAVGQKSTDLFEYLHLFALDVICETSMGVKLNGQIGGNSQYLPHMQNVLRVVIWRLFCGWASVDLLFRLFARDTYNAYNNSIEELHRISNEVIEKRTKMNKEINDQPPREIDEFYAKPKKALLDFMLEEKKLSPEQVRYHADTFIFAGQDTSATGISLILLELSRNPEVQTKLYEEIISVVGSEKTNITTNLLNDMKYLDLVVKEGLRRFPPAPLFQRKISSDCYIDGIKFPKGTITAIHIHQLHQNPELYPEPEKFIPERFLPENQEKRHSYSFLPFSAGPRTCIGYKFATLEMKVALIKVIAAYEVVPVPGFKERLGFTGVFKSQNGFCVQLKNRN